MAVSFKTRKALGKRYGIDPAILLEMERLNQQYNLAPGREARGIQASQFEASQAQQASQFGASMAFNTEQARLNRAAQDEANRQVERGGMVSTATGLLTNAAVLRAMTKEEGAPFFGETVSNLFKPTTVTPAATDVAATGAGMGAETGGIAGAYAAEDAAAGAALTTGGGTAAMQGAGYGGGPTLGATGAYAAAIDIGRRVTAGPIEEQVGTTAKHAAGVAAETGKGLVIGTYIMPGLGTVIGGALGAIGGAVREATGTNWLSPSEVIIEKVFGGSK